MFLLDVAVTTCIWKVKSQMMNNFAHKITHLKKQQEHINGDTQGPPRCRQIFFDQSSN